MSTLLEKARLANTRKSKWDGDITDEDVELAIGWLKGEVSSTQCAVAYGEMRGNNYTGNVLYRIARILRFAYKTGKLVPTEKQ